jgi:serine/threonine protein kinase
VIGSRIGPYEVLSPLGAGGMGEVFRAKDVKLGRDVAIKVLPAAFASDPDRLARFQREAQVLASLNHPNIAAIYGLEDGDGTTALVLELVEGETLADRLVRGPIDADDARLIAQQIADALEAAHEHGIIHRDFKPANIKLAPNGKVKVLDFGLAKLSEQSGAAHPSAQSMSPTITSPVMMTNVGMILGTAAYMSPEQAKGRPADKRSDVWAFGCVLYEMLTGRRAFSGENVSDTLAAVLRGEPDWRAFSAATPGFLRRIVIGCLTKDHQSRIADFSVLNYLLRQPDRGDPPTSNHVGSKWAIPLLAIGAIALAASVAAWTIWRPTGPAPSELRLELSTPPTMHPAAFAISPDGRRVVFAAMSEGASRLWIRSLDSATARPLDNTEGARSPFWSPDSRAVGFFAAGRLKRVDVDSAGSVQVLAVAPFGTGGTWAGNVIVFSPQAGAPLLRVAETGGPTSAVTRLTVGEQAQFYPEFLPDGRHFVYFALRSTRQGAIYVAATDSPEAPRRLIDADSSAAIANGHLLFVRQRTLYARPFDFDRLELTGTAVPIAEGIVGGTADGVRGFSAAPGGPIVYRTGDASFLNQLGWFDRDGKERKIGDPDSAFVFNPVLSPDNRQVALWRVPQDGNIDIWLVDMARGVPSRFTLGETAELTPVWSPKGDRIMYFAARAGIAGVVVEQSLTAVAGQERRIDNPGLPTDWSRTGDYLLMTGGTPGSPPDILATQLGSAAKSFPVVQTPYVDDSGKFAPNTKWIAYRSLKSGRSEVYVQPFPGSGGEVQVSTNGGAAPRWSPTGNELFYVALDGKMMTVRLDFSSERRVVPNQPVALFATRIHDEANPNGQQYDVSNDGKRFLINSIVEQNAPPLIVLLNWKSGR